MKNLLVVENPANSIFSQPYFVHAQNKHSAIHKHTQ